MLLRLNAMEYCFLYSKERRGLIFVRLKLRAVLFRVNTVWIVFDDLTVLLPLWLICIAFEGIITFVVNSYCL